MESGQAEVTVLWRAWVDRFEGRRLAAGLSLVIIPLITYVGWQVDGPAVGIVAGAGVFACFTFLVAFAMARREVESRPAAPPAAAVASPPAAPAVADLDDGPAPGGPFTRFAG